MDCRPEQLITDCKYLTSSALLELINSIVHISMSISSSNQSNKDDFYPNSTSLKLSNQKEHDVVFLMELMISIVLENKDRLLQMWPMVTRHIHYLLSTFGQNPLIAERAVVGLLRIANRNLFRLNDEKLIAEEILTSLNWLLVSVFKF